MSLQTLRVPPAVQASSPPLSQELPPFGRPLGSGAALWLCPRTSEERCEVWFPKFPEFCKQPAGNTRLSAGVT